MNDIVLPSGARMPNFGLGTWRMGERAGQRQSELSALRYGLDQGAALIDTAEMYGDGGAEKLVGEAIQGRRDRVYLVSKVYPHNASRDGVVKACERSLRRLATDTIDLYLLHWRGGVPLAETLEGFQKLRRDGKIRDFGVSNFDSDDLDQLAALDKDGLTASNQVLYNLARREAEWAVLPWCRERGASLMAYCPLDQGGLLGDKTLQAVAERHNASAAQVALAWLLRQPGVVAIPKSSSQTRIKENLAARALRLEVQDIAELDRAFPPPSRPARLGIV